MIKIDKPIHILITIIVAGIFIPFIFWGDNTILLKAIKKVDESECMKISNPLLVQNCYQTIYDIKIKNCEKFNDNHSLTQCQKKLIPLKNKLRDSNLYKVISIILLLVLLFIIFLYFDFIKIKKRH